MVDGRNVLPLATSQDHKRLLDDDQGPNTGGMGAYSPAPVVTPTVYARVMRDVIQPTVAGLERDGTPYTGFLYAGLMIGAGRQRQGAGVQLPPRRPGDAADSDAAEGRLLHAARAWRQRHAGPDRGRVGPRVPRSVSCSPRRAIRRHRARATSSTVCRRRRKISTSSTPRLRWTATAVVTTGGRVLTVTALGDSVRMAQRRAYQVAEQIEFDGCQMRRDIGYRAVKRPG